MLKKLNSKPYIVKEKPLPILSEEFIEYNVIEQSQNGVSINYLNKISSKFDITANDWSDIMGISTKSIQRYQQQENTLSATQTEFVLKIEQLYTIGKEVFGNIDNFKQWMQKPAYGLGNKIPTKILTTISGINLVINQLMRIAHGVLA
jgi:putative toxin-antitoxin system antitoxin component (TIGR02293 family)